VAHRNRRFLVPATFAMTLTLSCPRLPAQTDPPPRAAQNSESSSAPSSDANTAQTNGTPVPANSTGAQNDDCDIARLGSCVRDFLHDQAGIWTSPLRLHPQDALWLAPLAAAAAVSLNYDRQTLQQVSTSSTRVSISGDFSNAGVYGAVGAAGAAYLIGKITHHERPRKIGVLSLEAVADAGVVTEALKLATNRERPFVGSGRGRFWPDDSDQYTFSSSFPSGHATIIWAFSHVIVNETPGHRWLHLGLYALASAVSVARVTSRNHFPSDVLVGSAIGYLVGGYVDRQHSDLTPGAGIGGAFTVTPVSDPFFGGAGLRVTVDPSKLFHLGQRQDEELVMPATEALHP
jgi:hypothetical protein